jgi:hypothetical protein
MAGRVSLPGLGRRAARRPVTLSLEALAAGLEAEFRASRAAAAAPRPPPPPLGGPLSAAFVRAALAPDTLITPSVCVVEQCSLSFEAPIAADWLNEARNGGDLTLVVPPPPTAIGRRLNRLRRWLRGALRWRWIRRLVRWLRLILRRRWLQPAAHWLPGTAPRPRLREVAIRLFADDPVQLTIDGSTLKLKRGDD